MLRELENDAAGLGSTVDKAVHVPAEYFDMAYVDEIQHDREQLLRHGSSLATAVANLRSAREQLAKHVQSRELALERCETALSQQRLALSDCQARVVVRDDACCSRRGKGERAPH
jgi:hypothetical protein